VTIFNAKPTLWHTTLNETQFDIFANIENSAKCGGSNSDYVMSTVETDEYAFKDWIH